MIVFRVDGNNVIGLGHVMRCISVAEAFNRKSMESVFILSDDCMKAIIGQYGYTSYILHSKYNDMEGEIPVINELLLKLDPQVIFVDSYHVTKKYLESISSICKVAYIDDVCAYAYPVDYLINYNIYASEENYLSLYKCENQVLPKMCLGIRYVPLREQFRNIDRHIQKEKCTDVLISTGGADPIHLAYGMVRDFDDKRFDDVRFHFVIGAANSDKDAICEEAKKKENVIIHQNVRDMKALMMECDMAVSAAGSTLYELCACGVPTITYVLADNQIEGARFFAEHGLMISIGDIRNQKNLTQKIYDEICKMCACFEKRKDMAQNMQAIVDGLGAERIARDFRR